MREGQLVYNRRSKYFAFYYKTVRENNVCFDYVLRLCGASKRYKLSKWLSDSTTYVTDTKAVNRFKGMYPCIKQAPRYGWYNPNFSGVMYE